MTARSRADVVFGLALCASAVLTCAPASHAQAPVAVLRFLQTPAANGSVAVSVVVERPNARVSTVVLRTVRGPCVEDVGGFESLAVLGCLERRYEIFQTGLRVDVVEFTADDTRRRIRRYPLFRARAGWIVVPRCREVADDPLACLPGT